MKTSLALIPPISVAGHYLKERNCFLLLPHLLWDDDYHFYAKKARRPDTLIILDNGAFEGVDISNERLIKLAIDYEVNEVVVPDVMADAARTLERLQTFYDVVVPLLENVPTPKRYMVVVQGTSLGECADFITTLSTSTCAQYVTTLGLPRHLLDTTQDKFIRLKLAKHIRHWYDKRYTMHFLGVNPVWPAEVGYLHQYQVRSVDTSMPFVFAYHKRRVGTDTPRLERPRRYFDLRENQLDEEKLAYNVFRMSRWVEDGI